MADAAKDPFIAIDSSRECALGRPTEHNGHDIDRPVVTAQIVAPAKAVATTNGILADIVITARPFGRPGGRNWNRPKSPVQPAFEATTGASLKT